MINIPQYELDWSNGRVTQDDLDYSIVDKKIALYESCSDQWELASLFHDNTIFAYATLRYNNKPIKLRPYQDAIINDIHRQIDVEGANQTGKSFVLCVTGLCSFLKDHGKNWTIVLVSRSQAQNSLNMRMIKQILKESNITYESGQQDSMTVMTRVCQDGMVNTIVCAIAGAGSLGYAADLLMLDEFEFWEEVEGKTLEWYYDQVFLQRTNETKGQIIIYSNPNGKNFVSENLQKRKKNNGEYVVHTYNFNFLANPSNTVDEWNERQSYMHPILFASTMAAQRTESAGAALSDYDIDKTKDTQLDSQGIACLADKPTYWALDLGFVYDQSCLVGGYCEKHLKEGTNEPITMYYFYPIVYPQNYSIPQLWGREPGSETSVPDIVRKHNWQQFELDLTGKEGNEVLANEAGLSCSGIKMSGQWKANWYERFITLCKQGRIKVAQVQNYLDGYNKNFEYQARTLRIQTKMPNGNTRPYPLYHHNSEKDHDDILDAIVMCLSMMDDGMTDRYEAAFFERDQKKTNTSNNQPLTTRDYDEIKEARELNQIRDSIHGSFSGWY